MLAVIGGSGFYHIDGLEIIERQEVSTPYGALSAPLTFVRHHGNNAVFLPRHGEQHSLLPSEINYRANIWALKSVGVKQAIAVSAAGSLRQELAPGSFVVPSQYVDHTKGGRAGTFFGGGLVAHVSTAQPACPLLGKALLHAVSALGYTASGDKTYVCVEGPRLGTRAESFFLRDGIGADIVGMTNVPEVFLAREAQISYATLAVVTDYDCWHEAPEQHVTVEEVIKRFGESIAQARQIVEKVLSSPPPINDAHRCVLAQAMLTPPTAQTEEHRALLTVLTS